MNKHIFFTVILFVTLAIFSITDVVHAQTLPRSTRITPAIQLHILSSATLNGIAGDYVTVRGTITNTTAKPVTTITTYLSLVDTHNKLPVDLEDWSAEKGLFIGSIDAGQTFPLNWKIHFVKAGTYSLIVVANTAGQETPQVSTITHFTVLPKKNLNPGHVLPVAFGTPLFLICLFALIYYMRQKNKNS